MRARRTAPARLEGESRPQPWDLLLACSAVYLLTGVARIHHTLPFLLPLKLTLLSIVGGAILYATDGSPVRSLARLSNPVSRLLLFLVIWATIGAPLALGPGFAIRYLYQEFYKVVVPSLLIAAAVRDFHDVRRLMAVYAVGTVQFAFLAVTPDTFRGIGEGTYDPNDSALFIVTGIPLLIYFTAAAPGVLWKALAAGGVLVSLGGMAASGSRGGFIALSCVLLYTLFSFRAIKPLVRIAAVAGVALGLVFSASDEFWQRIGSLGSIDQDYNATSIGGRQAIWARGLDYLLENPVFGVGISNFGYAESKHPILVALQNRGIGIKWSAPHSHWIEVAGELGFPGLIAFAGVFVVGGWLLWQVSRRRAPGGGSSPGADLSGALLGTLIALGVGGSFLSHAYGLFTWAIFGMVAGFLKLALPTGRERARRRVPARAGGGGAPAPLRRATPGARPA